MNTESNFVEFQNAKRIWAVGSIHSNYESFNSIKDHLLSSFVEGDKLIILAKRAIENSILFVENINLKSLLTPQVPLIGKSVFINQFN